MRAGQVPAPVLLSLSDAMLIASVSTVNGQARQEAEVCGHLLLLAPAPHYPQVQPPPAGAGAPPPPPGR